MDNSAGGLKTLEGTDSNSMTRKSAFHYLTATDAVTPFTVMVPQVAIDDLKRRLVSARWPERETVGDWRQGVPLSRAQALLERWRDAYDWRAFERRINAFPQFRTNIDGLGIHFLHVRSRHSDALPILLTHGWPGSVVEFLNIIRPLVDPEAYGGHSQDAFHVVVPSLPGHGFSDKPTAAGWDRFRTARAWGVLMNRLGYGQWVAQGGDWGSTVTHALAQLRPSGLVAAHVNWPLVVPEHPPENATAEETAVYDDVLRYADSRGKYAGYYREQATRPQTIAYALVDSPVAQATWIYEKLHDWVDHEGDEDALTPDEMLDDISLYWFTQTAGSAARFYWENSRGSIPFGLNAGPIELPMAATVFPKETIRPPEAWAKALWPNLFYWSVVEKGGHFPAWEQPVLFVNELRNAFRNVREI
jgi:pimeloyl-ACP methyl ester carboxylesterase